jgi:hypothetical protein
MRTHLLAAATTAALLAAFATTPAAAQSDAVPAPAAAGDAKPAPKAKKGKAKAAADKAAADKAAADAASTGAKATDAKAVKPAAKAKAAKKGKKGKAATAAEAPPVAPPAPTTTTVTIKQPPPPAAPAPLTAPAELLPPGPSDDDAPTIAHTPITKAMKNKPLVFTARMQDPSGIFQPVLYLRKRGTGDFIPIKMIGSKVSQGDYAVEVDAKLISVDLEYYLECYDNAGNGPSRAGSPDNPLVIKLESPPPPVVVLKGEQKAEEKRPAGAPPAISHSTVSKAIKGQPIEVAAKLVGDTGVSNAKVFFRHVGEKEFKELPMGNIGGDDYTATMPPIVVTGDLEYYLEAFDRFGNGPGRSGGPHVPYTITVTEKPAEPPPPPVIVKTEEKPAPVVAPPPAPVPVKPRLVKAPFRPNPGRWLGYLFMGGFVGSLAFAGGEAYSAWSNDQTYQHTFNYDGRLLTDLHQKSVDDSNRAKIFGIAAAGSLVVGITLLLIFPEYPETQLISGSGGDVTLLRF